MGGNVFKDCSPIKKELIKPTLEKYFEELSGIFPAAKDIFTFENFHYLGSTGKKEESGDIDCGIDKNLIIDNLSKFNLNIDMVFMDAKTFFKRAKTSSILDCVERSINTHISEVIYKGDLDILSSPRKATSGNIFTSFYQYNENGERIGDKRVQIDLMLGDVNWLKFAYHSSSYEGNTKGLHRTQLLVALFANKGYIFSHVNGVKEKRTQKVVAQTPDEAIKLLSSLYEYPFNLGLLSNYYYIIDVFKEPEFEDCSDFDDILKLYFKILDSTRCDIPLDLQDEWLNKKDELGLTGKFLPENSKLKELINGNF